MNPKNEKLWEIDLLDKSKTLLFKLALSYALLVSSSYAAENLNLQDARSSSEFCQGLRASGKGIFPSEKLMGDAYYVKYGKNIKCNAIPLNILKKEGKSTYAMLLGVYFGAVVQTNNECGVVLYNAFVAKAKNQKPQSQEEVIRIMNDIKRDRVVVRNFQNCLSQFQ